MISYPISLMDILGLVSLFSIMILLAALPSSSVVFVVASSASYGLPSGIAAALGIVVGDLIFVTLALLGMTALAETMGAVFTILRYLGGAYLIWLGMSLLRSARKPIQTDPPATKARIGGTFGAALLLTLGDIKAILFYASLFPVFVNIGEIRATGILAIIALTAISVGGVKIIYALLARRIASRFQNRGLEKKGRIVAGTALIGAGGVVLIKP